MNNDELQSAREVALRHLEDNSYYDLREIKSCDIQTGKVIIVAGLRMSPHKLEQILHDSLPEEVEEKRHYFQEETTVLITVQGQDVISYEIKGMDF